MDVPPELIAAVNAAQWDILALPGVTGIGVGFREDSGQILEELAVRVYVADKSNVSPGIPDNIGGVAICLIEGSCTPVAEDRGRYSPLVGGIRIECALVGFGTLGAIVQDAQTGALLGLSAYHVTGDGQADFPYTIWQPQSPIMVAGAPPPSPTDNIGRVIRFEFPRTPPLPSSSVLASALDASVIDLTAALNQGRGLSPAIADMAFTRSIASSIAPRGRPGRRRASC